MTEVDLLKVVSSASGAAVAVVGLFIVARRFSGLIDRLVDILTGVIAENSKLLGQVRERLDKLDRAN